MSTAIGVRFIAGRYHATPWHRHVNEADVEWPPSPVRLLRSLIAVWHRKADQVRFPEDLLERLIERLAEAVPVYHLPKAVVAHSRHFMPVREGRREERTLVFDAFLRVDPEEELVVAWPDITLDDPQRALLAHLLERLGYLGRAESWTECHLLDTWEGTPNSVPEAAAESWGLPSSAFERVELVVPMAPNRYALWAQEQIQRLGLQKPRRRREKNLRATLPERFLDALRLDTGEWRAVGWSAAPGTVKEFWLRPPDCFTPERSAATRQPSREKRPTTVRFALLRMAREQGGRTRLGPPLPLMLDAIRIGEAARCAAMSKAGHVPPEISGHETPWHEPHQHAFYLVEDLDGDGRVDHLMVHAPRGFGRQAMRALGRIDRLWLDSESEWRMLLERYGMAEAFPSHPYLRPDTVWQSVTPYLHPWHRKKSFTVEDQIRRELRERGLPEPTLERLPTIVVGRKERRSVHFHRFRAPPRGKASRAQPDTQGTFWRLTFPEPVPGPIALGFGCHYGLGLFAGSRHR